MKNTEGKGLADFLLELQKYEKGGVDIYMDGKSCSSVHAASKCLLREEGCYMRDYVCDERNRIIQIRFDRVSSPGAACSGSVRTERERT